MVAGSGTRWRRSSRTRAIRHGPTLAWMTWWLSCASKQVSMADPSAAPDDISPVIDIDTFARIDLRVGEVLKAERVPNADKLLRLEVDLAEGEPRQLVAGIAEWYQPEQLVGE